MRAASRRAAFFAAALAFAWLVGGREGPAAAPTRPRRALAASVESGRSITEESRALQLPATPGGAELPEPALEQVGFFGQPDAPVLESLRGAPLVAVERGGGGRSLGFRVTLRGGQRGYYKPEQTFSAANWFGEVAAYHLDRMLGLGRVPAVVSRKLPWAPLQEAAGGDGRVGEVIVRDGHVRGAFVAWVDGELDRMEREERWEPWLRLTRLRSSAVTPFQRTSIWKKQTRLAKQFGREWLSKEERARLRKLRPEPVRAERPAELSDLVVFDYLTKNMDRWGGRNGNILVRGKAGPLLFLDNGASFEPGDARPEIVEARLHMIERFRRSTILALRAFDIAEYEARLAGEALAPVLSRAQLEGLETRRKALLDYVAQLEAEHGEAIWLWD